MPKVLRIINRFNLGGPTYNVAYLSKYMPSNYQTILVGGEKEKFEESSEYILEKLGLKPIIIPEMKRSLNPINDLKAFIKLVKLIKKEKPDIIHTHASKAGALGRIAGVFCKVPVIIHTFHGHVFHSYFGKTKTYMYKLIERLLALKTTAIIAISEQQKQELVTTHAITNSNKVNVIPLGFDLTKFTVNSVEKRTTFRNSFLVEENDIAIAIIGRLTPIKNHHLFIDAINYCLNKTNKRIRSFIIGDGENKELLIKKCEQIKINYTEWYKENKVATITFTSWIKDIESVLPGVDIVTLTSLNEGTPVSLIEALACNKAVIATNVGGIKDIIINNESGIICNVEDKVLFAEKLLELIENQELRTKLASKGLKTVIDKYHYIHLISNTEKLYQKCLNS